MHVTLQTSTNHKKSAVCPTELKSSQHVLFLLVAQRLANHIKSSSVKGIDLMGREVVITQLADNTTVFLKDENQISALDEINEFSEASGLCLNINKCELMSIKECSKSSICDIPIKNEVNNNYEGPTKTDFLKFNSCYTENSKK